MAFGVLAGQITVIFLEVLLGYVGARSGIIKDRDSKFLSDFIMKLLLPCTMLAGAAVDGEPELLTQAGVLFVLLLALFVVTTGLCRLSSWLHHDTPGKYAVLVGTAAMPNCGFIGLPLCSALLGTARGTVFAGMAMASYNVWFFTYVVCLFRPGEKIRLKTFITPTNIATVAMLVLLATGWRLPAPVQQFCSAVGGCTTPLALIAAAEEETAPAAAMTDESVREAAKNVRVWPVSGSTQAAYSVDALQYNATTQDWRTHAGVDLAASVGTPVKAAGSGVVTAVYDDEFLGTTVVINHPDGHVSQYSNLAVMPSVSAGDSVEAGQTIGAVGETALLEIADEPHLHFAVYANGDTIDPAEFIR